MRGKFLVINETRKQGTGRASGKPYDMLQVTLADKAKVGRLKGVLQASLEDVDKDMAGKLEDNVFLFDITEIKWDAFNKCVECRATLVRDTQPAGVGTAAPAVGDGSDD